MRNEIADPLLKLWELSTNPVFMAVSTGVAFALFYAWKRTPWRAFVFSIAFPGFIGFLAVNSSGHIINFYPTWAVFLLVFMYLYITLIFPSFLCGFLVVLKCFREALKNKNDYKPTYGLFLFIFFQFLCIGGTLFMAFLDRKDSIN
ncbi:MAG: hypothetical protein ACLP7P_10545 [Rhodomicrobium sp.]